MNDDLVGHENNIIEFGDDDRIAGDGLQRCLDGLVLGLVGGLSFGFCFAERGRHNFLFYIWFSLDHFRREKILGRINFPIIRKTIFNFFTGNRIMILQKILHDAKIRAVKFMRFRYTRYRRRSKT